MQLIARAVAASLLFAQSVSPFRFMPVTPGGGASVTFVRKAEGNGNGTTTASASFGALPAAGNTVVVAATNYTVSAFGFASCTDNQGNGAYSKAVEITMLDHQRDTSEIWYKTNIGSPSGTFTVTCTIDNSETGYTRLAILELSGVNASTPVRDTGSNRGLDTSTDASVTSSGSSATTTDLVVAVTLVKISGSSDVHLGANATTGYTNASLVQDYTSLMDISCDYKSVTGAGSQSANWSHDATTTAPNGWAAVMAIFRP